MVVRARTGLDHVPWKGRWRNVTATRTPRSLISMDSEELGRRFYPEANGSGFSHVVSSEFNYGARLLTCSGRGIG